MTITVGTPVVSADGHDIGEVTQVVADREKDIFSGLVFRSGVFDGERFIPGDAVTEITLEKIRLNIAAADAEALETYEP